MNCDEAKRNTVVNVAGERPVIRLMTLPRKARQTNAWLAMLRTTTVLYCFQQAKKLAAWMAVKTSRGCTTWWTSQRRSPVPSTYDQ